MKKRIAKKIIKKMALPHRYSRDQINRAIAKIQSPLFMCRQYSGNPKLFINYHETAAAPDGPFSVLKNDRFARMIIRLDR
jgi:hypothetical protein